MGLDNLLQDFETKASPILVAIDQFSVCGSSLYFTFTIQWYRIFVAMGGWKQYLQAARIFLAASYTTTIMTLVTISYERLKAATDPFNTQVGRWPHREYINQTNHNLELQLTRLLTFSVHLPRGKTTKHRCLLC